MTDILVIAEHRQGTVREVTAETIQVAGEIANGDVDLAMVAETPDQLLGQVSLSPLETIHTVSYPGEFNHDVYVQAVASLVAEVAPAVVLAGNTVNGLDYLPALASRLDWPLVTDAIGIDRPDTGIEITREAFGSKVETSVEIDALPAVISIRPGEWPAAANPGDPAITEASVDIDESALRTEVSGLEAAATGDVDITEADVLVSVGRGIGDEENLELIEELADALGATISSSRPIVDSGWLPKNRQVGQSGKTVSPDIYIAIGISGAVQHVAGMKGANTVVAINIDPDAPIFELADVGIVDDLFEVVPALIDVFTE